MKDLALTAQAFYAAALTRQWGDAMGYADDMTELDPENDDRWSAYTVLMNRLLHLDQEARLQLQLESGALNAVDEKGMACLVLPPFSNYCLSRPLYLTRPIHVDCAGSTFCKADPHGKPPTFILLAGSISNFKGQVVVTR